MAFLLRKRIKGIGIAHQLSRQEGIEPLSDERKWELIEQLKIGNLVVVPEIVRGHTRLAIDIAGQYARRAPHKAQDLVSEAMVALVEACHRIADGKVKDGNLTGYFISRMHMYCLRFLRKDQLFGVSQSCNQKRKKKGKLEIPVSEQEVLSTNSSTRYPSSKKVYSKIDQDKWTLFEIRELLDLVPQSPRQTKILQLKMNGYTLKEIAESLGLSKSLVGNEMARMENRYEEMEAQQS